MKKFPKLFPNKTIFLKYIIHCNFNILLIIFAALKPLVKVIYLLIKILTTDVPLQWGISQTFPKLTESSNIAKERLNCEAYIENYDF